MQRFVGIDFGTTNSTIAVADEDRTVTVARFPSGDGFTETFRSAIYFEQTQENSRRYTRAHTGPDAIPRYMASEEKGRFVQSLKAFLPSTLVRSTQIFRTTYLLEDLVSFLIRQLHQESEASLGALGPKSVVGRPVRFSSREQNVDDELAINRLRKALAQAGMTETRFEYEPVAAAYYYESLLDQDELVLVADFGGGTSDFSLLNVGPSFRRRGGEREVLGSEGIALAGDAFDAKIVRYLVSDLLGQGSFYRSLDKLLEMPAWIYRSLERWHHLSFLKSKETMDILHSLKINALEPEKIENLIGIIECDLGLQLHQAVQRTKIELSEKPQASFSFCVPGISISRTVTRQEFDVWIHEELEQISSCLDRVLTHAGGRKIDRIFLTGGSSFVPAVCELFTQRFGPDRMVRGSEFTSVAKGLALRSFDLYRH